MNIFNYYKIAERFYIESLYEIMFFGIGFFRNNFRYIKFISGLAAVNLSIVT